MKSIKPIVKLRHTALHAGVPPPFWEDGPLLQMLKLILIPAYLLFCFGLEVKCSRSSLAHLVPFQLGNFLSKMFYISMM